MSYKNSPMTILAVFTAMLVTLGFVKDSIEASGNPEETAQVSEIEAAPVWTLVPESTTTTVVVVPETTTTLPEEVPVQTTTTEREVERLPVWEGDLPAHYGGDTGCTREEASIIARAMWAQGAFDADVAWMLRTISRESTCDSAAHNGNRNTGDDSWGLCQQNNLSGWFNEGKLLENYDRFAFANDFSLNAESCALMWSECGRGPWNYGNYYCSTPKKQDVGLQQG